MLHKINENMQKTKNKMKKKTETTQTKQNKTDVGCYVHSRGQRPLRRIKNLYRYYCMKDDQNATKLCKNQQKYAQKNRS